MNIIKTIPLVSTKRYLIFGDIHGRYDSMMDCLSKANYDPSNDILFTVGDMIDRGPNNLDVLHFFNGKNKHSVLGNHEEMALRDEMFNIWQYNGGDVTLRELGNYNMKLQHLQELIEPLPYVIMIGDGKGEGSFRIIHAEFPLVSDDMLNVMLSNPNLERESSFLQNIIWGREVAECYKALKYTKVPHPISEFKHKEHLNILTSQQIIPTFSGHTPMKDVVQIGSRTYLDTGMSKLTLIDAHTKETWSSDYVPIKGIYSW